MKKIYASFIFISVFFALAVPALASDISFDALGAQIKIMPSGGENVLYLPSFERETGVRLTFDEDTMVFLDGQAVQSGDAVRFPDGLVTLTVNGEDMPVYVMRSANIAAAFISTESGSMDYVHAKKGNGEGGSARLFDEKGALIYEGALSEIKGRGNYTWQADKKPYQIKFAVSADLFSMGKSKKWVLLANAYDDSLMRNSFVFDAAKAVGIDYTSNYKPLDLYTNGEYAGSYLLCEKVQVSPSGVSIADLEEATEAENYQSLKKYPRGGDYESTHNGSYKYYQIYNDPADITGGYLLEFEYPSRYVGEASGFVTNQGQCVTIKSPEYATKAQAEYISDFVNRAEAALYSENYTEASKYFDMASLAKMYLLEEFVLRNDAITSSFYFYKNSDKYGDGKLHFAPVWDFDLCLGNDDVSQSTANGWYAANKRISTTETPNAAISWFGAALKLAEFRSLVSETYNKTFFPALNSVLYNSKNRYIDTLGASYYMDCRRWNKAGGKYADKVYEVTDFARVRLDFMTETIGDENFRSMGESLIFTDVSAFDQYYDAISFVVRRGLFFGPSETTFEPDTFMTRAMLVTVLARAFGADTTGEPAAAYADVDDYSWYSGAVNWATHHNIVNGFDGKFRPNDLVSREEICAIFMRTLSYYGLDVEKSDDASKYTLITNDWSRKDVLAMLGAGLFPTANMPDDVFIGDDPVNRAEVAELFRRYFEK